MSVFERTQQLIRYTEALVLFGKPAANRFVLNSSMFKLDYQGFTDIVYRSCCTFMSLVLGFVSLSFGYTLWTLCLTVLYLLLYLLIAMLGAVFRFAQAEVLNSSIFNWGVVLVLVSFVLLPPPSVYSNSGVRFRNIKAVCGMLAESGVVEQAEVDDLRESMEVREQRVSEWLKIPRWISTALWIFFLFFVQWYLRNSLDDSQAVPETYQSALLVLGLATLVCFLVVQSCATTTDRILKTIRFALIEHSAQIRETQSAAPGDPDTPQR